MGNYGIGTYDGYVYLVIFTKGGTRMSHPDERTEDNVAQALEDIVKNVIQSVWPLAVSGRMAVAVSKAALPRFLSHLASRSRLTPLCISEQCHCSGGFDTVVGITRNLVTVIRHLNHELCGKAVTNNRRCVPRDMNYLTGSGPHQKSLAFVAKNPTVSTRLDHGFS